ncbi:two-component system sensor histidine kinase NtrB [Sneathiella glossodoripedis]|uniref:two-component system sensor histidine kinase NtrB n=1 Tax=Sneathiella glossodoripedis TaxID=418853 RepID=UPI0004717567|nr:PAS domain-containing sensor histidine kinase [Sneathiella glossodoripedis]
MNIISDHNDLSYRLKDAFELITYSEKTPAILSSIQGQILSVNPAARKIGLKAGDIFADILVDAEALEFLELCAGSRGSLFSRQELILPGGERKQYRFEGASLVQDSEHALIVRLCDIEKSNSGFSRLNFNNRISHERALSELRLQTVIDAALDIIILTDRSGRIVLANKAIQRLTGYSPGEVIGAGLELLMPGIYECEADEGEQIKEQRTLASYIGSNPSYIGSNRETFAKRKDESLFPVKLSFGESLMGSDLYYTGIIHDLSGYKEIEQKLQQSQKMEALGKLSGGVAHDFNNLLAVVIGRLEFASDFSEKEEVQQHLNIALKAAEKGAALIDQLLSFSRQKHLNNETLNLSNVVSEAVEMLSRVLGEHIQIKTDIKSNNIMAIADAVQLNNALINIATNSRDALGAGGVIKITVDPAKNYEGRDGEFVKITVSDTGTGMSQDVLDQAIEPFFTTKDVGMGTGLGLSMVHGYVKQSGGFMTINSSPDEGTVVSLFFKSAS